MSWTPEAVQASWDLAEALRPKAGETFPLHSRSRTGRIYEMIMTPDGIAVHQGEGCEGEPYNGPTACWHSKKGSNPMIQAVTTYSGGGQIRQFTDEDIDVLKKTICKGASDAELSLFVATCKHTGLDPFVKQIYAIKRKVNNGTRDNPKWEEVMSIQVGIDGYRLVAQRTGQLDGMDGPQWSADGQQWIDAWYLEGQPRFSRCAVYRKGIARPYVGVCRWEAYNQGNAMWTRMGPEQLAKCAEALALRRAFPAEMSELPNQPDFIDPEELALEGWPAGAIEGEVVKHGNPQEAEVQPRDATANVALSAPPAAPPTMSEAQAQARSSLWLAIKNKHGQPGLDRVSAWMERELAYARLDGGKFSDLRITAADAERLLIYMLDLNEGEVEKPKAKAAPKVEAAHEHDPAFDAEGRYICRGCGELLTEPTSTVEAQALPLSL